LRDKAWARRFARNCGGDLGITRAGPRYRFPIRIWTPTRVPKRAQRTVTVPADRVVKDCPQGESPWKPIVNVPQGSTIQEMADSDRLIWGKPVSPSENAKKSGTDSPSRADRDVPATPLRAYPSMAPAHGPDLPASVAGTNCTVEDGRVVALALDGQDLMQAPQPF
jgi:hypothetical protein